MVLTWRTTDAYDGTWHTGCERIAVIFTWILVARTLSTDVSDFRDRKPVQAQEAKPLHPVGREALLAQQDAEKQASAVC